MFSCGTAAPPPPLNYGHYIICTCKGIVLKQLLLSSSAASSSVIIIKRIHGAVHLLLFLLDKAGGKLITSNSRNASLTAPGMGSWPLPALGLSHLIFLLDNAIREVNFKLAC